MILNEQPHNGHFELFMLALERLARSTGRKARICSFINERLYWKLKKRDVWAGMTMDALEYDPHKIS